MVRGQVRSQRLGRGGDEVTAGGVTVKYSHAPVLGLHMILDSLRKNIIGKVNKFKGSLNRSTNMYIVTTLFINKNYVLKN